MPSLIECGRSEKVSKRWDCEVSACNGDFVGFFLKFQRVSDRSASQVNRPPTSHLQLYSSLEQALLPLSRLFALTLTPLSGVFGFQPWALCAGFALWNISSPTPLLLQPITSSPTRSPLTLPFLSSNLYAHFIIVYIVL